MTRVPSPGPPNTCRCPTLPPRQPYGDDQGETEPPGGAARHLAHLDECQGDLATIEEIVHADHMIDTVADE
jgi:hypothetical protein